VQRPSTRFVSVKTDDQLDLQALHRVRSHLISERTAVINQIRSFPLEREIPVRQGLRFLRRQLPEILAKRVDVLSPRMIRIVEDLGGDCDVSMSVSTVSRKRSNNWHMAPRVVGS
jgi:transposase